jgi:membrane protein DedA with SNARE-associated domain
MFEWITGVIGRMGYAGVAALTFLENLFPPIPSELVIPLAGFVAAQGDLRLDVVIVAATIGSVAGATLWYEVGRRIGERRVRAWVDRSGKWLTLSAKDVDRAQAWFKRHGKAAVFVGRLVPGVRTFISLPAGFARMPLGPFLLYSLLGSAIWTAALAYAGVVLRANFSRVGDWIDVVSYALLGIAAVLMIRRYINCWRAVPGSPEQC